MPGHALRERPARADPNVVLPAVALEPPTQVPESTLQVPALHRENVHLYVYRRQVAARRLRFSRSPPPREGRITTKSPPGGRGVALAETDDWHAPSLREAWAEQLDPLDLVQRLRGQVAPRSPRRPSPGRPRRPAGSAPFHGSVESAGAGRPPSGIPRTAPSSNREMGYGFGRWPAENRLSPSGPDRLLSPAD